jgi:ABC-type transport system involved in cytochrome bd biosynthesis fused ATPase/permease subunit
MDSISEEYGVDQAATSSAQSEPVVSVRGLVKRYGSREAVAGIDLEVRRGEIFAFLGPNGAGKTTTVEILEGFRQRTGGQVSVLGHDPATAGGAWRDRVGVVLQESEPEPGLSVRECLAMYAGFYRAPRDIDETIALPPGLSLLTEPEPGGSTVVHSESPLVHLQMLGNWALGHGFGLPDPDVRRPALEEVYLSLTGPASTKDQR